MEIKFKQRGKVVIVKDFLEKDLPKVILDARINQEEGVDLTHYQVIYAINGRESPKAIHARAPHTIVVYVYNQPKGWRQGILLPAKFNPRDIVFYYTEEQKRQSLSQGNYYKMQELCKLVAEKSPNVWAQVNSTQTGIEIFPVQEVSCLDWFVRAQNLEEALQGINAYRKMWEDWNIRGKEAFIRHTNHQNPKNGSIILTPSPYGSKIAGICIDKEKRLYVIFEKQENGTWKETGTKNGGPKRV